MRSMAWRATSGGANYRPPASPQSPPQYSAPQQASPQTESAPDMSAYRFAPPAGARQNDLAASNLPYNLWKPAATNAANKAFGNTNMYQSWTLPGYTQSFNDMTGRPTSERAPSWEGNNAYQPVGQRAAPVEWTTTGLNGQHFSGSQGWQQAASQRDAFAGGLIQRLGEYQTGQQSGRPAFDFQSILGQANDSLKNNTWHNPFMDPRASTPTPTMYQTNYAPSYYQAPYQ